MASTLTGDTLTVSNINANEYEECNVPMDEDRWRLPAIDVGKTKIVYLRETGLGGYPSIKTPDTGNSYAVFVESEESYKTRTYGTNWRRPFLFLGIYSDDEQVFLMPSSNIWVMYMRLS